MEVKTNYNKDNLFCHYCKQRINIGEKYCIIEEEIYNDTVNKIYHLNEECTPSDDEIDNDIWIDSDMFWDGEDYG